MIQPVTIGILLRKIGTTLIALAMVVVLMAPVTVRATSYVVTITLTTSDGRLLWTLSKTVETPDSTLTLNVPQKLYDLVVDILGTDSVTTPFSTPIARGFLVLSITSDPPGLTIKLVPVPAGEVVVDGRVNIIDAATLAVSYGLGPNDSQYSAMSDFNLDGRVDILDAAALGANYDISY
jgi:hypothetical protein